MANELPFDPFFLIKSSFSQTVLSAFLRFPKKISSERKIITLKDEDKLALEITTPKKWKKEDLTVVIVHGLCGSHKSPGIVRLTRKLLNNDIKVVRLNLRGCGSGRGLAKNTYHAGNFEDVVEAVLSLKEENPDSPIVLIGFSLGGNLVLKLAGEMKEEANRYMNKIIALSPPVDLKLSVDLFEREENKIYLKHFSKLLKQDLEYMRKHIPDFPDFEFSEDMSIKEFNKEFVVPYFGFKDLDDYYKKTSAKYVLSDIKIFCKVLFSEDDPLVSHKGIEGAEIPKNVQIFLTKKGGHLGYLGNFKDKRGFFWLDNVILDWIRN